MSQAPKPPNPFDLPEEAQISQMVSEGGPDTFPSELNEKDLKKISEEAGQAQRVMRKTIIAMETLTGDDMHTRAR